MHSRAFWSKDTGSEFAKSWRACWSRKDHSMRLVSATGSAGLRPGLPHLQFLGSTGFSPPCILLSPPHPLLILSFSPLLIVILILLSFSPTQGSQLSLKSLSWLHEPFLPRVPHIPSPPQVTGSQGGSGLLQLGEPAALDMLILAATIYAHSACLFVFLCVSERS